MKRIVFLLLIIISLNALGQPVTPSGYTRLYTKTYVNEFMSKTLHFPSGGATPTLYGGWVGAGAAYYDTVGSRLMIWDGSAWSEVGTGGTGTVTSFSSGNLSPLFTSSVATATTTPALTFSLSNTTQYTVFGRSASGSGAPSYVGIDTTWISNFHLKVRSLISLTTTGTSGAATYNSTTGVLNIPQYSGGSGSTETLTNVGAGSQLVKALVGTNYDIRSIVQGFGVTVTQNTNDVTVKTDTTVVQSKLKYGNDFTKNGDTIFLKGDFVNVKDFGAVGDGSTNDRAAFQAAIATGKSVYVPAGTFYLSGASAGDYQLSLNVGQVMFGDGMKRSRLYINSNTRVIAIWDSCTIRDLAFIGSGKAAGSTWQCGIILGGIRLRIANCWFEDFSGSPAQNGGGGIFGQSVSAANSDGGQITNCYFYNNNGGLVLAQRAEYIIVSGCTFGSNTVAIGLGAGNISINGCNIHNNTTGIKNFAGTNNAHNTVNGCILNHNTYPLDLADVTHDVGYQFTGLMMYFGAPIFTNVNNIKFEGGNWDQLDSIRIDNSYYLQRSGVFYGTNTLGGHILVTLSNGAENFSTIGEIRKDASTPNYWIKQVHTDSVLLTGPVYTDGRLSENQGVSVASANNLTLGSDGNSFEITGTTQINLITSTGWRNGSVIRLLFTTTPTVKHNQTTSGANVKMLLAGGADFSATADDVLTLELSTVGGVQAWREVSRSIN